MNACPNNLGACKVHRRRGSAFTLVEVLVAVAIVGIVFVALMQAFATGLRMYEQSQRMAVATTLADEIHQMTLTLPLADPQFPTHWGREWGEFGFPPDDVDDLDGQICWPPVTADGTPMAGLTDYTQNITVVSVSDSNFDVVVADGASNVSRVTVTIKYHGDEVARFSWLVVGAL